MTGNARSLLSRHLHSRRRFRFYLTNRNSHMNAIAQALEQALANAPTSAMLGSSAFGITTLAPTEASRYRNEMDEPITVPDTDRGLLTKVTTLIDDLYKIDQRAGFFALNGLTTSLGYSVLNAHVWAYRKSRSTKPLNSIDIFNDGFADDYESIASARNVVDLGFDTLPQYDMTKLTGVYKRLLYQANTDELAKSFAPRMPSEILLELTKRREESPEVIAAYASYHETLIAKSPAAAAIVEAQRVQAARQAERDTKDAAVTTDYVLSELQGTRPEGMNDDTWEGVPMWIRYKFVFGIHKQACSAIAREQQLRDSDFDKMDALLALAGVLQLELEAAARTSEVKAATNLGRLDNHQLVTNKRN